MPEQYLSAAFQKRYVKQVKICFASLAGISAVCLLIVGFLWSYVFTEIISNFSNRPHTLHLNCTPAFNITSFGNPICEEPKANTLAPETLGLYIFLFVLGLLITFTSGCLSFYQFPQISEKLIVERQALIDNRCNLVKYQRNPPNEAYKWLFSLFDSLPNVKNKTVLITGCDSGFGHELALKCLRHDMIVFAGCLTEKGCKNLQDKAEKLPHGTLHDFIVNVGNHESVKRAKEHVEEILGDKGLDGIVNNAGVTGEPGYDDWLTLESYKSCLEVNLFGVIRITHAFKDLVKKNKGRIVNVASVCGRVGLPALGPYTVSKYGVNAYTDVLRNELYPFGVKVIVLEPGFFKTALAGPEENIVRLNKLWEKIPQKVKDDYGEEFFEKYAEAQNEFLGTVCSDRIDYVVHAYFHALTSRWPKKRYAVGIDFYLIFWPLSLLPTEMQDFIMQVAHKIRGIPLPKVLQ